MPPPLLPPGLEDDDDDALAPSPRLLEAGEDASRFLAPTSLTTRLEGYIQMRNSCGQKKATADTVVYVVVTGARSKMQGALDSSVHHHER